MAIFRVVKDSFYSQISNKLIRDKRLSLKARGLMVYMLSMPDDWDFSEMGLVVCVNEKRDSIRSALKELENYGYLVRERKRDKITGRLGKSEYTIYESPMLDFPTLDKPTLDKPMLEKQPQLNTNILNTKELNTNTTNMAGGSSVLDLEKEQLGKLVDFWNTNVRPIVNYEFESLRELMKDYGYANTLEAIKISIDNNSKKISYVKSTAENLSNGVDFRKKKEDNKPEQPKEKPKLSPEKQAAYERLEARLKGGK